VASVTDFEVAEAPRALRVWHVIEVLGFFPKIVELDVLDYADDREVVCGIVAQAIVIPNRIAEREESFGGVLADDYHRRRGARVRGRKVPAGNQRDLHGPKIVKADDIVHYLDVFIHLHPGQSNI